MIDELTKIIEKDKRYKLEAYLFVLSAVSYTLEKLGVKRHLTGQELLKGIKGLAREKYGLMAKEVFKHWGVNETIDFGHIVFNLVAANLLRKTDEDKLEDFKDIYDFDEVFVRKYPIRFHKETKKKSSKN